MDQRRQLITILEYMPDYIFRRRTSVLFREVEFDFSREEYSREDFDLKNIIAVT